MRPATRLALPVLAAALLATSACREPEALTPEQAAAARAAEPRAPLYEKLGGRSGVEALVDDVLSRAVADSILAPWFARADMPRLRAHLIDQIGQASGGPERYAGRDMKTTHAGLGIDDAAFDAMMRVFAASLDHRGVGEAQKRILLGVLEPMRADIVEH